MGWKADVPRFNVQRPSDKKWACFSTVIDDYITPFMSENEYQEWRETQYGKYVGPISDANQMTYNLAEDLRKDYDE